MVLVVLAVLLVWMSTGAQLAEAGTPVPPAHQLDLSGYQTSTGLIQTFKNGTVADPYFGLYALELSRQANMQIRPAEQRFITWGLAAQQSDGRFERFCLVQAKWAGCGKADSDDATLARWIHLLYAAAPPGQPLPKDWARSIALADAALTRLRMANGVYSVFMPGTPGYEGYALFADNVEVLGAFEKLPGLLQRRGDTATAALYAQRATALREAITVNFGSDPQNLHRLALGASYDKVRFYPHGVAAPVGWLEGYFSAPTPKQWDDWAKLHYPGWLANAKVDFPWGLIAVASSRTASSSLAACWLERTRAQRQALTRWNVLEEVAAQVLQAGPPSGHNCSNEQARYPAALASPHPQGPHRRALPPRTIRP